ncbi:MAG: Gfo/Idh/MocA family oxidoreductase [Pirellulaceae bacterium]
MNSTIRVGIIGAGANTRLRHIPGFQAIGGVQLLGVVNRSAESTAKASAEFSIPKTYASWQDLVADPEIDAVMIGTWPNLHAEVTCAALDNGKHVLTEARMARNLDEARQMHVASTRNAELVAQVVPSPFGLREHDYVMSLLKDGFLGDVRELVVIGANDQFQDATASLHWRQDQKISGKNLLAMGILHETAMRWAPPTTRVFAQTATFAATRPKNGDSVAVTVPDSAQVVTQLANGGRGIYHLSGCALFGPGLQIHLYGSQGTIKLQISPEPGLWLGRVGESSLRLAEIPAEQVGGWRVEQEFIAAIRGNEQVNFTHFTAGLEYMQFTDAVADSAQYGAAVDLPTP